MTIDLDTALTALSKDLGDYWAGTTTSDGDFTGATLVDDALGAFPDAWITDYTWDRLTSGSYVGEERKVRSLAAIGGELSVRSHTVQILAGTTYEIHRICSASDKRTALVHAAGMVWPWLYDSIRDESKVSGNWLMDGSFEDWTDSATPTYWSTAYGTTLSQENTDHRFLRHGATSAKFTVDTYGQVFQRITENQDIFGLRGNNITFSVQAWCDTASALRLVITDGTNYTYSDYHPGDSAWTSNSAPLTVSAAISSTAPYIVVIIEQTGSAATAYLDDARLTGGTYNKVWIGDLGMVNNEPSRISYESSGAYSEPWQQIRRYEVEDGWLLLHEGLPNRTLRIEGRSYLDFKDAGVSSTLWGATINLDSNQLKILTAQAAIYLYQQLAQPNWTSGERKAAHEAIAFWKGELAERVAKFRMPRPSVQSRWK